MSSSFGACVEFCRVDCQMYRKTLAKYMGIDPTYLEEIENDEVKPEAAFVEQLSDVLHLTINEEEWLFKKLEQWKKREGERRVIPQLRCNACHRPIARERAIGALHQSRLDGGGYKKVLLSGGSGGQMVSLGTTCARKYGIVYTDDDW